MLDPLPPEISRSVYMYMYMYDVPPFYFIIPSTSDILRLRLPFRFERLPSFITQRDIEILHGIPAPLIVCQLRGEFASPGRGVD